MRSSWLPPQWNGRERIHHPVNWARLPEFDVGVAYVQTKVDHGHENRWYLYVRKFNEADIQAIPVLASTVITSSPGTTQTITSDSTWNNNTGGNVVEVIGAGARGAHGASTSTSGGGGGGGAYTRMADQVITTPGTTPMYVRVGGTTATDGTAGGDSWWTLTSPGTSFPVSGTAVGAKGGAALVSATTATGGTGGASASAYPGTPTAKTNGGNGGTAGALATAGAGGGGAGGWSGNGITATGGPSAGGAGNNGTGGGGTGGGAGSPGTAGGAGTNIQTGPNAGSGGGGGGGNASPSTGGAGGLYGGGGGGGGRSTGVGGQGAQGVIVLTWTPVFTGTLTVTEATDTAAFPGGTVAWNAVLAASEDTPIDLLLHLDGVDASTTFPDSGGYNRTVTPHGAAQIDDGQSVFASQALMLGADADYLSVDTGAWAFGTGDFTVDFRARLSSASEARMFFDGGATGFQILHDGSALKFKSSAGTITGSGLSANTNYHLAATRASGSTRLWKDGVQEGSTLTDATNYGATSGYPRIGGPAVVTVTGTMAVTEASDVAAFTGTRTAADVVPSGRTLWYNFDSLTVTDDSGNSNTGTIAGSGTTLVTGHIDSALSFNGSGYITFTSMAPFTLAAANSEISICCWVKLTATDAVIVACRDAGGNPIIDLVVGFNGLGNNGSGTPSCIFRCDDSSGLFTATASTQVNNGAWHHVAVTHASDYRLRIYVDGVLSDNQLPGSSTSGVTPTVAQSAIGKEMLNGTMPMFVGQMDDFRVYNRALTGTEIGQLAAM